MYVEMDPIDRNCNRNTIFLCLFHLVVSHVIKALHPPPGADTHILQA